MSLGRFTVIVAMGVEYEELFVNRYSGLCVEWRRILINVEKRLGRVVKWRFLAVRIVGLTNNL